MTKQNHKANAPQVQGGKLAIPGLDDATIRVTEDGRFSVYDVIRVACGSKNPWQIWGGDKTKRKGRQRGLSERYPELLRNTEEFKFSGRGGAARPTPVITKQGLIELLQVLPGEVGAKFRKETAQIILRYLDGDTTLADEVVDRAAAKGKFDDIERHNARTQGILARNQFTKACSRHGVYGHGFAQVTNAVYHGICGKAAKDLREERGLKPTENFRKKGASTHELAAFTLVEHSAPVHFDKHAAYGNEECAAITYKVADAIAKIMKGEL